MSLILTLLGFICLFFIMVFFIYSAISTPLFHTQRFIMPNNANQTDSLRSRLICDVRRKNMSATLRLRNLTLVFAAILLVGCAPYINSYYLPESAEGYLSGHSKRTSDEPLWILERDGATFYISAGRDSAGYTTFKLNIQPLRLPGERSLSAKKRDKARAAVAPITVDFTNLRKGALVISNGHKKSTDSVRVVKGQYGTNNRSTVELSINRVHLPVDHYLELSAFYKGKESDVYAVEWPSTLINGRLVKIPIIKYEWKSGIQVQFVNG